ncbi:MAG TPA: LPS export ABC transporter periplasmic protein LptC [Pyrinomonadaceae bacterium]|nr:LPS export ABC transporter periplasmic protein LptC [Pyrinomonadaceae bacterium]
MQEVRRRRAPSLIGLRARAPVILRVLASLALVGSLVYVGIAYYRGRNNRPFRLIPGKAELSTTVERRVENYERRVTEGNRLTMLVRATLATSYSDGHHELENAHIEYYAAGRDHPDKIDARQAIYFVETESIVFNGNVQVETRDKLIAKSETISYDVKNERAEVSAPVTFARENIEGRSDAATVDAKNKKMELRGNVEITVKPDATSAAAKAQPNSTRNRPVTIRAPRGDFDQARMHLAFSGGATAEQDQDIMSGETLAGFLSEQKRIQRIEARTNSYLRTMDAGRAAEVRSVHMDFFFDGNQQLQNAVASQNAHARTLDADSEVQISAPGALQVFFEPAGEQSLLKEMRAEGRSVVTMAAPRTRANDANAANKKLTANMVKVFWRTGAKDVERAEAVGDAELIVEPVQQNALADRKTLNAPRFDCLFFESGNLAREFNATGGAKAVLTPVAPDSKRSVRTVTSQKMFAYFVRETQDVERLYAQGEAQFNDADRNGQAHEATYTAADETVRLRNGSPVVWDSRARLKATEIDSDTRKKISYGRGKAQTTYYSQEQTNGATPFSKVKSPVFIVSNSVEFQHETGIGIYTGEARAWQDDNFVSADRLTLRRDNRRMEGDGHVQSALYQARRKEPTGARTVVPVFATSNRMFYSDTNRLLHYEGNVDIKQGTERITSEVADVHLMKEVGEVERMVAERTVVVTQPGKRGTGNWAQYTAADETVMLTGEPARVEDAQQGTSESRRFTIYLRDNRVVSDSPGGAQSTGRVRSSHRIKKQ